MGFKSAVTAFLEWKRINQGRKERTLVVYALALRRLEEFFGARDPLQATRDELVLFTGKWLYDKGLRDPLSRKTHVAATREFYKWLAARQGTLNQAADLAHAKVGRRLPHVMTLDAGERLMWAPDYGTLIGVRDAAIMSVLMGCGLRVSGLCRMNESHLVHEVIAGRPRMVIHVREKGEKERMIPVPVQADLLVRLYLGHPELAAIDRDLANGDKVLWVSTRNRMVPEHEYRGEHRRMGVDAVQEMIKRYGRAAGLPETVLHPHAMRHMFGSELAEDDVPTVTASKLLGHSDPKSTEIYQQLAKRKLTQVIDAANPLAKIHTPVSDLLGRLAPPSSSRVGR